MQNEQIDGLTTNYSLAPLPEQERMRILNAKGMESSSKIDLRDVSWWMSLKDAYRPRAPITAILLKEGCIPLAVGGRTFHVGHKHDRSECGLLSI